MRFLSELVKINVLIPFVFYLSPLFFKMTRPANCLEISSLYTMLVLSMVLALSGCQSPDPEDATSVTAQSPAHTQPLRQITDDDGSFVTNISPTGAIESFRKGHSEISRAQLSAADVQDLSRLFAGWDELKSSTPPEHAAETICYGDKTVAVRSLDEAPELFKRASKSIHRLVVLRCSPDVPMATREDLEVGIAQFIDPKGAGHEHHVLAYLLNISKHDVRVYIPGFVGPNFAGGKGEPEGVPYETRVGARFGPGDFVCLRPGEAFSRVGENFPKSGAAFAY